MVIDLSYQIQNTPPEPAYAVIEQYTPSHLVECVSNLESVCRRAPAESEHFGGYITTISGTQASGVSGARQVEIMEFIPWEGKIPSVIIQLDYLSYLLEIKPELRITNQNPNV